MGSGERVITVRPGGSRRGRADLVRDLVRFPDLEQVVALPRLQTSVEAGSFLQRVGSLRFRFLRRRGQRAELDDYVFELVGASQRLRAVVRSELIRVA